MFCPYKKTSSVIIFVCSCLMMLFQPLTLRAQCLGFPATIADADCSAGLSMSNNMNAGSGTYGYCGSSSSSASFSGINLNGATLRVCGNATLGFGSWNSGSLVISCGATVTINSNVTLNNSCGIVNYGTLIINGNLSYQNSNNFVYNESATSKIMVSGNITFPANNGTNGYLRNAGYIKVGGTYNAGAGVQTCFMNGAQLECSNFVYMDQNANCNGVSGNRFMFGSSSGSCIFRYTTSANLYKVFANDSRWNVYRAGGTTETIAASCNGNQTGWGSANVVNSAPALTVPSGEQPCNTITCLTLPVELLRFIAEPGKEKISLYWSTASETANDFFTIERSSDAMSWKPLAEVKGIGQSTSLTNYTYKDVTPLNGINYYRLSQTDKNGRKKYFDLVYADHHSGQEFTSVLYPNPTSSGFVNIKFNHIPNSGITVKVTDVLGRVISDQHISYEEPESSREDRISLPQHGQLFFVMISGPDIDTEVHKLLKADY